MKIGNYRLPEGEMCYDCKMKSEYSNTEDGTIAYCWLWDRRLDYEGKTKNFKCDECLEYCEEAGAND